MIAEAAYSAENRASIYAFSSKDMLSERKANAIAI